MYCKLIFFQKNLHGISVLLNIHCTFLRPAPATGQLLKNRCKCYRANITSVLLNCKCPNGLNQEFVLLQNTSKRQQPPIYKVQPDNSEISLAGTSGGNSKTISGFVFLRQLNRNGGENKIVLPAIGYIRIMLPIF